MKLAKNTDATNFLDISIQSTRDIFKQVFIASQHIVDQFLTFIPSCRFFKYSVAVGQFKGVKNINNTTETQKLSFNIIRESLRSNHYPKYFIEKSFDHNNINNSSTYKTTKINKKLNYITLSLP